MPYQSEDQYSLVRTIRYSKKDNENPFLIRYFSNLSAKDKITEKGESFKPDKQKNYIVNSNQSRPTLNVPLNKNQKFRETQFKQIQQLKKFAKVDIKKLRKEQKRQAEKAKREQEIQQAKEERKEKQKPKKEYKNAKPRVFKEQKPTDHFADFLPLKKLRSKSISQIQREEFKKQINKPTRKIYEDYLDIEEIQESRRKGEKKYYRGVVEFGERIKWFAKIKTSQIDGALVAEGRSRNRCIHQDEVYFQILNQTPEKIYCQVVARIPSSQKRQLVGKIDFLQQKRLYYIIPINKRFIAMNVRMNEICKKWLKQINEKYFLVEFHSWAINCEYPQCSVISEYGRFGQVEIESQALLKTHNVYQKEFTEQQIQIGLKKFIDRADANGEYRISPEQIAKRVDLRNQMIFTIDPLTARDFDDALSIKKLAEEDFDRLGMNVNELEQDEVYEVGVHIADASFFVEEGSIIDEEAKKRTTSVYLVHRVLPMLPRVLCETMCSLNPGLERLTLSVWFYVDIEGNVLPGVRFDRTIIKSKARFTYEQAQNIIDGKIKSQEDVPSGFGCMNPEEYREIFYSIIKMNTIALNLRKKRIEGGSLIFQTPKKSFTLDESFSPVSYDIKSRCASNFLVEEYMLLANKKVGEILVENIKAQALLRRHRFPGQKKIANFEAFMKKIGYPLKVNKSTKIQEETNKILENQTIKMAIKEIIKHQMVYLLEMAEYFIVGDSQESEWLHYALNMPVYTHFTSPIRRYPDIIVHRQLISIIEANKKKSPPVLSNDQILKQLVDRCNKNKVSAKKVSSDCEKIFLCLYLKSKPAFTQAILVAVEEWGFKISVPKYDCRVVLKLSDLKNMKVLKFQKAQQGKKYMHVEVFDEQNKISIKPVLKQLQQIQIRLGSTETFPLDYKINLVFPSPKKQGDKLIVK